MTDTLDAQTLTGDSYQSANTLSGIAIGSAISIQNQTNSVVFAVISSTQPSSGFRGEVIPANPASKAYIAAGENEVWLKGDGPVSIQEV